MLFWGFLPYTFLYILFEIARYQHWTIDRACRMKEGLQLLTIRRGAVEDYWGTLLAARTNAQATRADEMEWISTGMRPSFLYHFAFSSNNHWLYAYSLRQERKGFLAVYCNGVSFGSKFRISELASFWLRNEHRGDWTLSVVKGTTT
jgi:hypothetical protein